MTSPKIVTSYGYPPIGVRWSDWTATLDDYDGAPDAGFQPIGHGITKQQAIDDLHEQIAEYKAAQPDIQDSYGRLFDFLALISKERAK